jgi:glycosyltransferase involved in cell wall biosynthesis
MKLRIFGCYPNDPAYPNVYYRVRELADDSTLETSIIHRPGWNNWHGAEHNTTSTPSKLLRLLWAHVRVLQEVLMDKPVEVNYIPYPAIGFTWLLSWLGRKRIGEHLVIDAFISIYDTVVIDRKILEADGVIARILFRLERRALKCADTVIVDTPQNAQYYADLFHLPTDLFHSCPLSTDESPLRRLKAVTPTEHIEVLFVGTMVPLQGIATVVEAARLLEQQSLIKFTIIGDGQDTDSLQNLPPNLNWRSSWCSTGEMAEAIAKADICLGIFGETAKTQRVIPYKVYAYCRIGRATITAASPAMRAIMQEGNELTLVRPGDAQQLANAIRKLAGDPVERDRAAQAAARLYETSLSNRQARQRLYQLFEGVRSNHVRI